MALEKKNVVEELKAEWKRLWQERFDDKVRAEGVATDDYSSLFVEKGTVIKATKDYGVLNFRDIITQHKIPNPDRYISPNSQVGGWTKFAKTNISNSSSRKKLWKTLQPTKNKKNRQTKKCGRGWLHR